MNATNNQIIISANGQELTATLAQNSSAEALRELLQEGPLTIWWFREWQRRNSRGFCGLVVYADDFVVCFQ